MKYIVTSQKHTGIEEIFIFPRHIPHNYFAETIFRLRDQMDWLRIERQPISAGFFEGGNCFGRSETLGLNSRGEEDTDLISIT